MASDEKLEWLLPWWWERLCKYSDLPLAFVDFGMTEKGRTFCQEKGSLISISSLPLVKKEQIPTDRALRWEKLYGTSLWDARKAWLKKPFALLATPFEETLWLDLDCEVLGSPRPLFAYLEQHDFAMALETESSHEQERIYGELGAQELLFNTGVIVYRRSSSLLCDWAREILTRYDQFLGDEQLLSRIIHEKRMSVALLDPEYNWRMSQGLNLNAQIIHWAGSWGKEYIRRFRGLGDELSKLTRI